MTFTPNSIGFVLDRAMQGAIPLYRYMNSTAGDHFFTTDAAEGKQAVEKYGYVDEGICCYISAQQVENAVPLYRLVKGGRHFYTSPGKIKEVLTIKEGYTLEGIAGYVWD